LAKGKQGARRGRRQPAARAPRKREPGMPDESSVIAEKTFTSPKGTRYRILKTTETDPYDPPARPEKKPR
jgi:hypothetical protein